MKFITDFCLYFAVYTTFWVVSTVFMSNANIYSWGAVISLAVYTALISNHYDGKHDEWDVLRGYRDMEFKPLFEKGENKDGFKKEFAEFKDKDGYVVGWYVVGKYWNSKV